MSPGCNHFVIPIRRCDHSEDHASEPSRALSQKRAEKNDVELTGT